MEHTFPLREVYRPVPYSYEFSPSWERQKEEALWQDYPRVLMGKILELTARMVRNEKPWELSPLARPLPIQAQGALLSLYTPGFTFPATGFLADLHVHTLNSHDSTATYEAVLLEAERVGLTALAITDHDEWNYDRLVKTYARLKEQGKVRGSLLLIPGEEISSREGHIVALFITEPIPPGFSAQETLALIHAQGGIAVAAHPHHRTGVGEILATTLPFDLREQRNPSTLVDSPSGFLLDLESHGVGVSDAHDPELVGACATWFPPEVPPTLEGIKQALRSHNFRSLCLKEIITLLTGILSSPLLLPPFLTLALWTTLWERLLFPLARILPVDRVELFTTWTPFSSPWEGVSLYSLRSYPALRAPLRIQGFQWRKGIFSVTFLIKAPGEREVMVEVAHIF